MSGYSLAQAAAAVGRNRSSVLRAIKTGKISAVRDEATSEWRIEPAELHRLYPPVDAHNGARGAAQPRTIDATAEIATLRARLDANEARFADAQDQIADLRRRLDAEADERRRLTAVLADKTATPAPTRRGWWSWRR